MEVHMPVNAVPSLHLGTPDVAAGFRVLRFLRTQKGESARLLITRTVVDPLARTSRAYGARQLNNPATDHADALTVTALSAGTLKLHTADGDVTLSLGDIGGRPLWSQNAQGTVSALIYEPAAAAGRPHVATEQPAGGTARIREQYVYALASDTRWQALNLAGAMTELSNNAGISRTLRVSLTGQTLLSEQRLLKPAAGLPDWKVTTENDTEDALVVCATYDATGTPLSTTNAANVSTITAYDISASVMETRLRYAGQGAAPLTEVVTLRDVVRRADGAVLSQTAGSGVVEAYEYDQRTQYLTRHSVARLAGHPSGALLISDLHYTYDPVGNILTLEDQGADPQWHDNQQATGLRQYEYDTCYRLTSATGRERAPVARYYGADPAGGEVWAPYSQSYTFDDGDNLTLISHLGGAGSRRRELSVAIGSNRATLKEDGLSPETGFLAGGLQKQLNDGRALSWYADSQLSQVSPVTRSNGELNDTETYHYADGGTRTRKLHRVKVADGSQTTITTYGGGCETRLRQLTGQTVAQKHVVITQGGGIRLIQDRLSRQAHLRFSFSDHLGSIGGETDGAGKITSREEYAPYGATVGSDEDAGEVSNLMQRTYRYSGKEMDATGLIYYGWRYQQPELGRWLSVDPGGLVDGINLFRFSRNNPINGFDTNGLFFCSSRKARKAQEKADAEDKRLARLEENRRISEAARAWERNEKAGRDVVDAFRNSLGNYAEVTHEGPDYFFSWKPGGESDFDQAVSTALESAGYSGDTSKIRRTVKDTARQQLKDTYISSLFLEERDNIKAARAERAAAAAAKEAAKVQAQKDTRLWIGLSAVWSDKSFRKIQSNSGAYFSQGQLINALQDFHQDLHFKSGEIADGIRSVRGNSYAEVAEQMESFIERTADRGPKILYRGVSQAEYDKWATGTYIAPGFVAFTPDINMASRYNDGLIITLTNARGRWVESVYPDGKVTEFLVNRGARFSINRKTMHATQL
ncbi:RHS repeat-associated core domain-containing protein [Pseudomonas sp. TWI628]|uniref:RHS repeat-associated core domain-containing protein n=1 Tax=Pseudomonas sp. TWI628 TaxID=3136788 RepID=UPI00320B2D73